MPGMVERRISAAALWSRRLALFAAMLFLLSGLGHRYGLIGTVPFLWLLGIVGALGIASLCAAAVGFTRLWEHGDKAGRSATAGALLALLVLSPFLLSGARAFFYPFLTDVSTDLVDPPVLAAARQERTAEMNPIALPGARELDLQIHHYSDVTGRRYDVAPDRVLTAVLAEAAARGWTIRGNPSAPEAGGEITVEAVAYTVMLGFAVDVAIRLTDEGVSTYVDMRSVSRYGKHDLGDNARRIRSFLAALDLAIKQQPVE